MAANSTLPSAAANSAHGASFKSKDELLSEILKCGICLCQMSSPCCLPCAHAFCRSCLLDYARNNPVNSPLSMHYIRCPYCTFQLDFASFAQLESMLVVNPTLKQLCEVLEMSKANNEQCNGAYQARCHACCSLQMLKICKHCSFMLCSVCRRTHLLDVHRESKAQLEVLEARLRSINEKRLQLDQIGQEFDTMRELIHTSAEKLFHEIEQQRDQALQVLDARQQANEELFWTGCGFDNGEKFDFFASLLDIGKRKLAARNITDRELMDLSDNLQTIPDVDEKSVNAMKFAQLSLFVDETSFAQQFICVHDKDAVPTAPEKSIADHQSTEPIQT